LQGAVVTAGDAFDLGRRLNDREVALGVFCSFEFAWAQQKYPELRPLALAINHQSTQRALLVVRNDSTAKKLADLKGNTLALPRRTREHCVLFVDRECQALGTDAKEFFGTILNHSSIEDALDDILRDKVQAAVVDSVSLETYEQIKPGCFARLRILQESLPFPGVVVAYRQGGMDSSTLTKFRDGMITANQTARGRDLMALWKLTAFEEIPADFPNMMAAILKAYPAQSPSPPLSKTK
jgi:ABC-type phosphate/phosphonate transport system substrate-binding protein